VISDPSTAGSIPSHLSKSPITSSMPSPDFVAAPTEDPHVATGIPQGRRDEASQRAGAAGEQDA